MGETNFEDWPITTGELVRLIGIPEGRIADAIRRGIILAPPVQAGRRLWWEHHVKSAAEHFGCRVFLGRDGRGDGGHR